VDSSASLLVPWATSCFAQPAEDEVSPDARWMQYATPEDVGWSSQEIADVKAFADSLGSDAVMLVYDGAVVVEWVHNANAEFIASIYKSLFNALYGLGVVEGHMDTSSTLGELGAEYAPSRYASQGAHLQHSIVSITGGE